MTLSWLDQELLLLTEGAVIVAAATERTLVLADVHLGKSAAFRALGVPIPEGGCLRDLERIRHLTERHGVARVVIAGDLFHARAGMTAELKQVFQAFVSELGIPFVLVAGNHDLHLKQAPPAVVPELAVGAFRIIHDPAQVVPGAPHLCGHWHPVAKIADGRRSIRRPCFLIRGNALVLPAFGSFTGGGRIAAEAGDRHFVALRERVVELPASLLRR
jgi:uncharacterized protein